LELALIGFPGAGKSTLFRAVTEAVDPKLGTGARWGKAQVGVVKVPDIRVDQQVKLFRPQSVVQAELRLVDFPAWGEGLGKGAGITGELFSMLQRADALVHVVRGLGETTGEGGPMTPQRAAAEMDTELAFADLAILERRVQRLESGLKGAKQAERAQLLQEKQLFERVKAALEQDVPILRQGLDDAERRTLREFQFLTAKPLLVVVNVDERALGEGGLRVPDELANRPGQCAVAVCAKLEEELLAMSEAERAEFRTGLGVPQNSRDVMIQAAYELLDMVTFLTVGPDEVRAWPIERNTVAVKAAGKVHSDIERGFIRAEVIHEKQLLECGSLAEARKRGLLRLEGKTYVVQDGDVINFLFNV
jgi:hypothetical protein